jgi:hypothetical protein
MGIAGQQPDRENGRLSGEEKISKLHIGKQERPEQGVEQQCSVVGVLLTILCNGFERWYDPESNTHDKEKSNEVEGKRKEPYDYRHKAQPPLSEHANTL